MWRSGSSLFVQAQACLPTLTFFAYLLEFFPDFLLTPLDRLPFASFEKTLPFSAGPFLSSAQTAPALCGFFQRLRPGHFLS